MITVKQKSELYNKLNNICDKLRSSMDASEYKNYILGFIFYKYLSDNFISKANKLLKNDQIDYLNLDSQDPIKKQVQEDLFKSLGYLIEDENLFVNWILRIKNQSFSLSQIENSFKKLEEVTTNTESEKDFVGLFDDINLASSKLGNSESSRLKMISDVLLQLDDLEFKFEDAQIDILGDAYEFLISKFASEAGKKAGEFYTPQEVSSLIAKIVTLNKKNLKNAYDPTCGSGSLLLQVNKECNGNVGILYGQEKNNTTFNLARMNMFLSGKKFHHFNIKNDDTILEPKHLYDEKGIPLKFDVIVANPPFSQDWDSPQSLLNDPRFRDYGRLAPKSKMDYAFIQHMLYQLKDDGVMASVAAHGVLFRGGAEGVIRQHIIEKQNYLDAVIGLPANLFFGTSIPSCILVFKKNRNKDEPILFIEASREFEKGKKQNKLSQDNINKILDTYANRKEVDKYSKNVTLKEIQENEYNLNITRYVDTFEEEEEIDIVAVNEELKKVNAEIEQTEKEIQAMIDELVETR